MANIGKDKKYHYTYRTVNLINGRYYLGMHSSNRLKDWYLGSGTRLRYEINKYGKSNFKLEILQQFNSREELIEAEIKLITEQDLQNVNCLNCKAGGVGFTREQQEEGIRKANSIVSQNFKNNPEWVEWFKSKVKEGRSRSEYDYSLNFKGKQHSEDTIQKIKQAKKNTGVGESNSQFGTCWITDEVANRKIKKESKIPEGWRLGKAKK